MSQPNNAPTSPTVKAINMAKRVIDDFESIRANNPNLEPVILTIAASTLKIIAKDLNKEGNDGGLLAEVEKICEQIKMPDYVNAAHPEDQEIYDKIVSEALALKQKSE